MDFKQLVLEELIDYKGITFKLVGGVKYMNSVFGGIVDEKPDEFASRVFCLKDSKNGTWWVKEILPYQRFNETPKEQNWRVIQEPTWYKREKGGYKRGIDRHGFRKKIEMEVVPRLLRVKETADKEGITLSQAHTIMDI